jgi:flagellar hook-associated protein 3 FlgL
MRVTFSSFFRNGLEDINRAAEEMARSQREVSSLKRVQVPSDDPSAMSTVISERSAMRGYDQYVEATDSADSRLRVIDSTLSDVIKNLTSAQTTVAAAHNSFLTTQQREAYALQLEGIRDAVLTDVTAQFRGTYLFSGTAALTTPYVKDAAGIVQSYQGDNGRMSIDIDRGRAVDATIDGSTFVGDLFDTFENLLQAVRNGDGAGMDAGLVGLAAAFDRTTNAQSRVGNELSTLEDHKMRLGDMRRAADSRRSELEDANLAEAITKMQQADAAHRAALGAVSTGSRLSLLDYLE